MTSPSIRPLQRHRVSCLAAATTNRTRKSQLLKFPPTTLTFVYLCKVSSTSHIKQARFPHNPSSQSPHYHQVYSFLLYCPHPSPNLSLSNPTPQPHQTVSQSSSTTAISNNRFLRHALDSFYYQHTKLRQMYTTSPVCLSFGYSLADTSSSASK